MPVSGLPLRTKADMYHKLKQGLVAYWPLADASAVDLEDYWGYGDLTNNNTVTRADGPSNNLPDAASFTAASSQYLSRAPAGVTLGGLDAWEVVLWVNLTGTTGERVPIGQYDAGNNQRSWMIQLGAGSSVPVFTTTTSGAGAGLVQVNGANLGTGAWHMVGVYFTGSIVGIHVDAGTPVEAAQTSIHPSTGNLTIGARGNTPAGFFNGLISPVVMRTRVWTQSERDWYYNDGEGRDLLRGV